MAPVLVEPVLRGRWLRKFPVTTILLVQYLPFVVMPAVWNATVTGVLVTVLSIGLGVAFTVECLIAPLHLKKHGERLSGGAIAPQTATLILAIGCAATALAAVLSPSAYAVQIGRASSSPLLPLLTPLTYWLLIGTALLLVCRVQESISRRQLLSRLAATAAVLLFVSIRSGFLASLRDYTITVALAALLIGVVRLRTVVAGLVVGAVVVFPVLYEIRNEARVAAGANRLALSQATAQDRLREDYNLNQLDGVKLPFDFRHPSPLSMIRYGLIPSALDPGRPPLSTGVLLSIALSGNEISASTFTVLGNTYALGGARTEGLYVGALAAALALALRRPTPVRIVLLSLSINGLLLIETNYPDGMAQFVQSLVAAAAAGVVLKLQGTRDKVAD